MGKTNTRQLWLRRIQTTLCIIGVVCLLVFQKASAVADDFKEKVAPIFEANCVSCHGSKMQRSGLDLRSLEAVLRGGARGKIIVPGHPERSLLYKLITHAEDPKMPMGMGKLSDADIAAIAEWITQAFSKRNRGGNRGGRPGSRSGLFDHRQRPWILVVSETPATGCSGGQKSFVGSQRD